MSLTIIGSDLHAPYLDDGAFSKFVAIVREKQPDRVILNGDIWDCYQLSRFDKDPIRITGLQSDMDAGFDAVATVRRAAPNAELILCEGNHEARLRKFVWKIPELASLRALSPEEFFQVKRFKATWVPYGKQLMVDGCLVIHGSIVRKRAGFTAQANIDLYGTSVACGHVHRLATVHRTVNGETRTGVELGCLCQLDADYMHEGVGDWQHGYGIIENGVMQALPL